MSPRNAFRALAVLTALSAAALSPSLTRRRFILVVSRTPLLAAMMRCPTTQARRRKATRPSPPSIKALNIVSQTRQTSTPSRKTQRHTPHNMAAIVRGPCLRATPPRALQSTGASSMASCISTIMATFKRPGKLTFPASWKLRMQTGRQF